MIKTFTKQLFVFLFCAFSGFTITHSQELIEVNQSFTQLELSGNLRVSLVPVPADKATGLEAQVYGVQGSRLKWYHKDGVLSVALPSNMTDKDSYAELTVYYDTLSRVNCDGVEVQSKMPIVTESFRLEAGSSVNRVRLEVKAQDIEVVASGNSDVTLMGSARWLTVNSSLWAKVNCVHGDFEDCVVTARNNSDIVIRALERLEAKITGKASVFYTGSAEIVTDEKTGGALVEIVHPRMD